MASSSIELALSRLCEPGDIITPEPVDLVANQPGHPGQNHKLLLGHTAAWHLGASLRHKFPSLFGYWGHMPASQIRQLAGENVWNSYFKISIERNPWDRQVSLFYFKTRKNRINIDFRTFMTSGSYRALHKVKLNNFDIYSIRNKVSADYMMRYESLNDDFSEVLKLIGIKNAPELPRVKTNFRKKPAGYRDYYDDITNRLVENWYSREINSFDYVF